MKSQVLDFETMQNPTTNAKLYIFYIFLERK